MSILDVIKKQVAVVAEGGAGMAPGGAESKVDIAVEKIVAETGCTPVEALAVIDWTKVIVGRARKEKNFATYMTQAELDSPEYQLFDAILGHVEPQSATAPAADSAGEALSNAVIDPSLDEFGLTHFQRDEYPHYCTVRLLVGVAKTK